MNERTRLKWNERERKTEKSVRRKTNKKGIENNKCEVDKIRLKKRHKLKEKKKIHSKENT